MGGDPDFKIDTHKMYSDLARHAGQLNDLGAAIGNAVDERIQSERFKAELITNVSHDLKTPLTSIINYVDLLKKQDIDNPKAQEYIEVLDRKSQRLKKLTEDLVEASKASTGSLSVHLDRLGMVQLVQQALGEFEEKFAQSRLTVVPAFPEEECSILADGRHLWRVIDNLLSNCNKYALEGTRIYVEVCRWEGKVVLSIKNISRQPLNIPAERLMERFVRGEESRTTEGSGLGLAIARSFTELQDGTMEVSVEGDLFRVLIRFKRMEEKPDGAERGNDGDDGNDGGDWNGGGDGSGGSGNDEIERGAHGFRGGLRGIVRRKAGETTGKMGREFSKASKRRAAHERTKAREEELKRETARAKEAAKQREQAQANDPEPEAEWDFGQDEAWNAVLDDGKEQETP